MEHFEAQLEVDNREVVAGNSLMSCSVAHMEHFVDNILAGNKASNRFPDEEVVVVADRNIRMDSEDMFDNAFDAWVENSQVEDVVEAHIDMVVSVLNRHLLFFLCCSTKVEEIEEE